MANWALCLFPCSQLALIGFLVKHTLKHGENERASTRGGTWRRAAAPLPPRLQVTALQAAGRLACA